MEILDILIMIFLIISIIWTFIQERNEKEEASDASGTEEEGETRKNQKPVPATMSEDYEENIDYIKLSGDDHKRCNHCGKVIGIKDNFCSYCGLPNPKTNA